MPLSVQQINVPTHSAENSLSRLVAITQVAPNTTLDATAKHFCNQIWDVIRVVLYSDFCFFEFPEQI